MAKLSDKQEAELAQKRQLLMENIKQFKWPVDAQKMLGPEAKLRELLKTTVRDHRPSKSDTLCWKCINSYKPGHCPWADHFDVRDDWTIDTSSGGVRVCECAGFDIDTQIEPVNPEDVKLFFRKVFGHYATGATNYNFFHRMKWPELKRWVDLYNQLVLFAGYNKNCTFTLRHPIEDDIIEDGGNSNEK